MKLAVPLAELNRRWRLYPD